MQSERTNRIPLISVGEVEDEVAIEVSIHRDIRRDMRPCSFPKGSDVLGATICQRESSPQMGATRMKLESTNETPPIAVDEAVAAAALGVSIHFLRKDRRTKRLFPFYRIGDRVLYNLDRVRATLFDMEEGGSAGRGSKRVVGAAR